MYKDISSVILLKKYLQFYTQTDNEAINSIICGKSSDFDSKWILKIDIASSFIEFNDNSCRLQFILNKLGSNFRKIKVRPKGKVRIIIVCKKKSPSES